MQLWTVSCGMTVFVIVKDRGYVCVCVGIERANTKVTEVELSLPHLGMDRVVDPLPGVSMEINDVK